MVATLVKDANSEGQNASPIHATSFLFNKHFQIQPKYNQRLQSVLDGSVIHALCPCSKIQCLGEER
jgi:hypothetical protein